MHTWILENFIKPVPLNVLIGFVFNDLTGISFKFVNVKYTIYTCIKYCLFDSKLLNLPFVQLVPCSIVRDLNKIPILGCADIVLLEPKFSHQSSDISCIIQSLYIILMQYSIPSLNKQEMGM